MKKEELVAASLPEALVSDLRKIEAQDLRPLNGFGKLLYGAVVEWKKERAARLYSQNKITPERAAMEAGVSVREMIEHLRSRKIQAQHDLEDLEDDMKNFYRIGKPLWPAYSHRHERNSSHATFPHHANNKSDWLHLNRLHDSNSGTRVEKLGSLTLVCLYLPVSRDPVRVFVEWDGIYRS